MASIDVPFPSSEFRERRSPFSSLLFSHGPSSSAIAIFGSMSMLMRGTFQKFRTKKSGPNYKKTANSTVNVSSACVVSDNSLPSLGPLIQRNRTIFQCRYEFITYLIMLIADLMFDCVAHIFPSQLGYYFKYIFQILPLLSIRNTLNSSPAEQQFALTQ